MSPLEDTGTSVQCCFFATTATDGKVMFWDVRIERTAKKVAGGSAVGRGYGTSVSGLEV